MEHVKRRWRARLLATGLSLLLLVSAAAPAVAQTQAPDLSPADAVTLLRTHQIVQGDQQGNLLLTEPITRAQLATIIVRALGREADAQNLRGTALFPDVKGHWADGYIAVARLANMMRGYPDGTFGPDRQVTYAESLAVILRLVNKEPTSGTWPDSVLIQAVGVGINPGGVPLIEVGNQAAVRSHIFHALGKAVVAVPLDPSGTTVFTKYIKPGPPTLTAEAPASVEGTTVTVTGKTNGRRVTVNGQGAQVQDGAFSATVSLSAGENTLTIVATDVANQSTTVVRQVTAAGVPASIEVSGPTKVNAGASATYSVTVKNAAGATLGTKGLSAVVTGNIGTFDANTLTLKAGATRGSGTITFGAGSVIKAVNVSVVAPSAQAAALDITQPTTASLAAKKDQTVVVAVVDADGNRLTDDNGREVTLAVAGIDGATVTPPTATTVDGNATFKVRSSDSGEATLRATSGSLTQAEKDISFSTGTRIVLSSSKSTMAADGSTSAVIRAYLEDADGNRVVNRTGGDIEIQLSESGPGSIADDTIVITAGSTSSSDHGELLTGNSSGTSTVTGQVVSTYGSTYSVERVTVRIGSTTTTTTTGSASIIEAFRLGTPNPSPGDTAEFVIRLTDRSGVELTEGSYAFQVKIDTSNKEDKTHGLPEGIEVWLGDDESLNPVDDGKTESDSEDTLDIIARTTDAQATIHVRYNKSGTVTVTPVTRGSTDEAVDEDGDEDDAKSTSGLSPTAGKVYFRGTAADVKLVADSDAFGTDQPAAAMQNQTSRSVTLRAIVVDEDGYWITDPQEEYSVTIEPETDDYTTLSASGRTKTTKDGKAEWRVSAKTDAGVDSYRVTSDFGTSNSLLVQVDNAELDPPLIAGVGGVTDADDVDLSDTVGASKKFLRVELERDPDAKYGIVKVYRDGSGSIIYTSDAIDLGGPSPYVLVPRDDLPTGSYEIEVRVRNGYSSDSDKSEPSATTITVPSTTGGGSIRSAKYDANARQLIVTASGISTTGEIDTAQLSIVKGADSVSLADSTATINSSSKFTIDLDDDAAEELEGNPDIYNGTVNLAGEVGWYVQSDGDLAQADRTSNPITPLGWINYVVFDGGNNRLYLHGKGYDTGTHDRTKLSVTGTGDDLPLDLGDLAASAVTKNNDKLITVNLGSSNGTILKNGSDLELSAAVGWLYDGTSPKGLQAATDVTIYTKLNFSSPVAWASASNKLTISGTFSADAAVDETKLRIVDMTNASDYILELDTGAAITVSATKIEIVLSGDTLTTFKAGNFKGSNIYLEADGGWYTIAGQKPAPPIEKETLRVQAP